MNFHWLPPIAAYIPVAALSMVSSQIPSVLAPPSLAPALGIAAIIGAGQYIGLGSFKLPVPKPGPKDWSPRSGRCHCKREA